jgi:hypothetical protein
MTPPTVYVIDTNLPDLGVIEGRERGYPITALAPTARRYCGVISQARCSEVPAG